MRKQVILNEQEDERISIPQHTGEWTVWVMLLNGALFLPFVKHQLVKQLLDSHCFQSFTFIKACPTWGFHTNVHAALYFPLPVVLLSYSRTLYISLHCVLIAFFLKSYLPFLSGFFLIIFKLALIFLPAAQFCYFKWDFNFILGISLQTAKALTRFYCQTIWNLVLFLITGF